jgi:copper chaperone
METKVYEVKGMSCDHCKHAVESALREIEGISKATVSLEKGEVSVEFSALVSMEAMVSAVDDAGYELVTQ